MALTPALRILPTLALLLITLAARLAAQSDAKPAPVVAGKWAMVVSLSTGDANSVLDVKLDGRKLSGTISSDSGVHSIAGEYADRKLTFVMDYQGQTQVHFAATLKDDGTLTGTMDYGQGPFNWKAERVPER